MSASVQGNEVQRGKRGKMLGGVTGKGFRPGLSGNPAGRAHTKNLEQLARTHTEDAIKALVLALKSPRERVPAAVALLDRGWGKPVQMVSSDRDRPLVVDFRWADNTSVSTAPDAKDAVLEAVVERVEEQLSIAWREDDK